MDSNLDDMRDKIRLEEGTKERSAKRLNAITAGTVLAMFAILLTLAPSDNNFSFSIQQKNVAALLAGMFGFTSVEAFRRSF